MAAQPAVQMVPIPRRGVDYRGKVVLAPMVRSGELPSRLLALHYGADLVWGPETVDYSMLGTTRRVNPAAGTIDWTRTPHFGQKAPPVDAKESVIFRMHPGLEGRKLIFQLGTADPARAVEAARVVAADVAGVDVNAGCPKPFSTSGGMGAALLKDPDRLCAILEALVRELSSPPSPLPPESGRADPANPGSPKTANSNNTRTSGFEIGVSVKIRLLETPADTEALVRRLVQTGITALTVHCRTTPMRPRERAIRGQLEMIRRVCHEAGVACLMNGDVESRDQAEALVAEYGVDGAMIATAAEKNSSCFRTGAEGGPAPWDEVVARYVRLCLDTENKFGNTKFLLSNMIPGKKPQYQLAQKSQSYSQLCEALGLTELAEMARDVDAKLELDQPKVGKKGKQAQPQQQEKTNKNNPAALASGGNMAQAREASARPRKSLSERGINAIPHVPQTPVVEATPELASVALSV